MAVEIVERAVSADGISGEQDGAGMRCRNMTRGPAIVARHRSDGRSDGRR